MTPEVIHTTSFVDDAVRLILDSARDAIAQRGIFRVSLSGGRTPAPVYQAWAAAGQHLLTSALLLQDRTWSVLA